MLKGLSRKIGQTVPQRLARFKKPRPKGKPLLIRRAAREDRSSQAIKSAVTKATKNQQASKAGVLVARQVVNRGASHLALLVTEGDAHSDVEAVNSAAMLTMC